MNDKDKEAFWDFWKKYLITSSLNTIGMDVWKAACEYKQKEIEGLKNEVKQTSHGISVTKYNKELVRKQFEKLQAENAKLKECVKFYADEANQIAPIYKHDGRNRPGADFTAPYRMDEGKRARQCLKELEEK